MLPNDSADEWQELTPDERAASRVGLPLFEGRLQLVAEIAAELARQEPDERPIDWVDGAAGL
jgi:hypothetical protein